jgi:kynureninase
LNKRLDSFLKKANELDQKDPLKDYSKLFRSTENEVYLDGNSLGKLPLGTVIRLEGLINHEWGVRKIRSWNEHWLELPHKIAAKLAKLLNASEDEIFVGDTTSLNLYKLIYAALELQKGRNNIITDDLNFPSDGYVIQGIINKHFRDHKLKIVSSRNGKVLPKDIEKHIGNETALITLSHVAYQNAFRHDMKEIEGIAHSNGALVVWDLSHSAGAIPVDLNASGAKMAVGCTYKYLNGGPGAPAFLYVARELQDKLNNPVWSWFGHKKPFAFDRQFKGADGIGKFGVSTPSILSLAAIEPGLDITLKAGIAKIHEKAILQSEFLLEMIGRELVPRGFKIQTPVDASQRGSHISISHPKGYQINRAMIEPPNSTTPVIIPDFRPPDLIRLGITPLYLSFTELVIAVERIKEIVNNREMDLREFNTLNVT